MARGVIGAGLFVGSGVVIQTTGPAAVLSFALTGIVVVMVMRMLGEMAVDMPNIRSFTEFSRAGLGHWAGFSVGWLYWYFWIVVIPVEAIAGANILQEWLPLPNLVIGLGLMGTPMARRLLASGPCVLPRMAATSNASTISRNVAHAV